MDASQQPARLDSSRHGCVVGLDLSLVGTAAVALDDIGSIHSVLFFAPHRRFVDPWCHNPSVRAHLAQESPKGDRLAAWMRVVNVTETVLDFVARTNPLAVALEDHAFGAQGASVYQLGWLHALVRFGLNDGGLRHLGPVLPFRLYTPQALKQTATGKGNAKKMEMIAAAEAAGFRCREYGAPKPAEDLADAFWCARLLHAERLVWTKRASLKDLPDGAGSVLSAGGPSGVSILQQPFISL